MKKHKMDRNKKDLLLLKSNPNQLIVELQDLIKIIVSRFIKTRQIKYAELEEFKQQINIALFKKIPIIQEQYQGKSFLRTYMSVIIRNICNEILRNKNSPDYLFVENYLFFEKGYEDIDPLILKEESLRLKKIIELFFIKKDKLVLCLKLKFKMRVDFEDLKKINSNITQVEYEKFLEFINFCSECPDNVIFAQLSTILNKYDNKVNSSDSLRKWTTDKINEIIKILNGNPPTSNYDKETFQILFEKSYFNENINQNKNNKITHGKPEFR